MWWYTLGVLFLSVINAELRRVYDLYFGFSQVEVLAILPYIALVPHLWSLTFGGGWRRLPFLLSLAAWIWVGGFSYALVIAVLRGNSLSGSFEFISFVFPIGIGLWVAADEAPFLLAKRRITNALVLVTTLICLYGILQYVVAPAWDVAWLKSIDSTTFGQPAPFQIRVFSMLADPGSFAVFLAFMLIMVLPRVSLRSPLLLMQIPFWLIALGLTLVRTAWLMFVLGGVAYLILSPRRTRLLLPFTLIAAIATGLVFTLPAAVGNSELLASITSRFDTFLNLENDESRRSRAELYGTGPEIIGAAPFGLGLGVLGTSTRLTAKEATTDFDSGYLGRGVEMGLPGVVLYITPLLILAFGIIRLWWHARNTSGEMLQAMAGMAVGLEVAFAYLLLAHDISGLSLLAFWLIECLVIRALPRDAKRSFRVAIA